MSGEPTYQDLEHRIATLEKELASCVRDDERYRLAFEASGEGLFDFNLSTGEAYLSPSWYDMLGYSPGELTASFDTWLGLVRPDEKDSVESRLKVFLTDRATLLSFTVNMRSNTGEWRLFRCRAKVSEGDSAGSSLRIVGTQSDITERQQTEDALRITRFAFERASVGIFRVGIDARIIDVNRHACQTLGYSREELCAMRITDVDPDITPEFWRTHWDQANIDEVIAFEAVHQSKGGRLIPVEVIANFIEFEGSLYSVSFTRDLTERNRQQDNARKLQEALHQSQKMEALGTLAGGIAHDFNNILSAVIGFSELSLALTDIGSEVHGNLQNIVTSGLRARDLVHQILTFSRKESRAASPLRIAPLINEVLRLLKASISENIRLRTNIAKDSAPVLSDPVRIHQIVMNLCTNAVHAMSDGGGLLAVSLGEVHLFETDVLTHPNLKPGQYLKLCVQDTGCGIPEDVRSRIFEPFFTTKGPTKGTGLGLSVVHGIVQDIGGSIIVYSEPERGTTINIYLPTVDAKSASVVPESTPLPSGTERILIVDDELFLTTMMRQMLENLGYRVTSANLGETALDLFRKAPNDVDLVITDMIMPQMTGDALASAMIEVRSDIPIILCTGFSLDLSPKKAKRLGIQGFLYKPVLQADLAGTVRSVLDQRYRSE